MPRFFIKESVTPDSSVTLSGDDAHHISYSLRMAVGDEISVIDGEGNGYLCTLSSLDGTSVTARVLATEELCRRCGYAQRFV